MTLRASAGVVTLAVASLSPQLVSAPIGYFQTNLTSDLPGVAPNTDPALVNPWGMAASSTSPIWISDNGTGLSTVYNGLGQPFPLATPLQVTIPPPIGGMAPSAPTGIVFTSTGFNGSHFVFATEDGTIAAWTSGTNAVLVADNSPSGTIYKGLALAGTNLYAADFHGGKIDVFDTNFAQITVSGGFTDPTIPSGFAPFNIQNIGGLLYVTYALQDADAEDDVPGAGNGFVDVFDANGVLQKRLISNGPLNSPWGLTLAPMDFGQFGGDLLVGNFGDGRINVFDPTTGGVLGVISDPNGSPIVNDGLWALRFGNGANGAGTNSLFFTAGIPGPDMVEDHGLFGEIQAVPEPASVAMLIVGLGVVGAIAWKRRKQGH